MTTVKLGQIKEFLFAEWLHYSSRVRDHQLQPLLKNMIKAEKNLGAGCNHNNYYILPWAVWTLSLSWSLGLSSLHSLTHYLDITGDIEILSPAGLAAERLVKLQLAAQENKFDFQLRVKVHKLDFGWKVWDWVLVGVRSEKGPEIMCHKTKSCEMRGLGREGVGWKGGLERGRGKKEGREERGIEGEERREREGRREDRKLNSEFYHLSLTHLGTDYQSRQLQI